MSFLSGAARLALLGACGIVLSICLESCNATDHSGDPGLITVTLDSSATRFSRLLVVLQDSAGVKDTLFDDSLKSPSQLRRVPTADYRGEKAVIFISGYVDGSMIYQEKRAFDSQDPSATKRDTLLDLGAVLTGIHWSAPELIITAGDSSHGLNLSVTPKKGDGRVEVFIRDSSILKIRLVSKDAGGSIYRLIPVKAGPTWVVARSVPFPGLQDSASILITPAIITVPKPVNKSPEWSTVDQPTWAWSSGGGKGIGYYRLRLDDDAIEGGKIINDTLFKPASGLEEGAHTLYVQERDTAGNWSPVAALILKVDLQAPAAPAVANEAFDATSKPRPAWTWTPQGGGIGTFRYLIDSDSLAERGQVITARKLTSPDSLKDGRHTLFVQERDSAGNWSASGWAQVSVAHGDTIAPKLPLAKVRKADSLGILPAIDSVAWGSGGGGGSGHYRYLLDTLDFVKNPPEETTDSSFALPDSLDTLHLSHALYVQERDSVGNWSAAAKIPFDIKRFSFIMPNMPDTALVLTIFPDSNKVGLTRRIDYPRNDAEKALQKRQLWTTFPVVFPAFPPSVGYLIRNPFANKLLEHEGLAPVVLFKQTPQTQLIPILWTLDPAAAGFNVINDFQPTNNTVRNRLNVAGPPFDETSPINLTDPFHDSFSQHWKFVVQKQGRYIE
ncbi:MAG: hypothetical protein JWO30_3305 [Fibrobacteres bacterium]|nr:hypothetical protein [Fibrobacterota bacterium]